MREPIVEFITTLDAYAPGGGWQGFWGLASRTRSIATDGLSGCRFAS